jgi:preprotein translocase subunit SecE
MTFGEILVVVGTFTIFMMIIVLLDYLGSKGQQKP